jgi:hypothetical protein
MPPRRSRHGAAVLTAGVLLGASLAAAGASPAPIPRVSGGPTLSANEARELADWALARPEVRRTVGPGRFRLVRAGTGTGRGGRAGGARSASVFVRDLASGAARSLSIDLDSGAVTVHDIPGLLQPGEDETREARAIVENDPELARWSAERNVSLQGGFHVRPAATADRDPCSTDVCVEFGFMRPDFSKGPARRVIVDLSRGVLAHRDYRGERMTEASSR